MLNRLHPKGAHRCVCIILSIKILRVAYNAVVNNFSTTFGNKQGFRAQPLQKETEEYKTRHEKEENHERLVDAIRPWVASLLGELVYASSIEY